MIKVGNRYNRMVLSVTSNVRTEQQNVENKYNTTALGKTGNVEIG